MGIDGEDGNGAGGAHGGKVPYTSVRISILAEVNSSGSGILVIGGGKNAGDDVTLFWNAIGAAATPAQAVTHVNGAANISAQSFAGFAVIGVASAAPQTPNGGLTDAENNAFAARAGDVVNFVNGGGGLFGLSQAGLSNPYGSWVRSARSRFNFPPQFQDVTATPAGNAVGITNTNLDVCCWHDESLTFPGFLDVLATNNNTGNPCAIGGANVIIVQGIVLTPLFSTNPIGTTHMVTATVADNLGQPVVNTNVTYDPVGPERRQERRRHHERRRQGVFHPHRHGADRRHRHDRGLLRRPGRRQEVRAGTEGMGRVLHAARPRAGQHPAAVEPDRRAARDAADDVHGHRVPDPVPADPERSGHPGSAPVRADLSAQRPAVPERPVQDVEPARRGDRRRRDQLRAGLGMTLWLFEKPVPGGKFIVRFRID
jgi:hypothetical protein